MNNIFKCYIIQFSLLIIISFVFNGVFPTFISIFWGIVMFGVMYLLMLFGNFMFKKESLGGADIKLMFISGLVLGPFLSFCVMFLSSVIALPVALFLYVKNKEKVIPYGPFIVFAIFLIYISQINLEQIISFLQFV